MPSPFADNEEILLRKLTEPNILNLYSLVLSAAKIPHRVLYINPKHLEIYIASDLHLEAEQELVAYELENANWPPETTANSFAPAFRAMSLVVVAFLVYIYSQTGDWSQNSPWFEHGAGNSEAILDKLQLYRLVTALTLHADVVHLLSNCILGGFLLHFFLGIAGNGLGLFILLFTGTLANYINVLAHGPGHYFVGFSTAIFSVIGMLCTISFLLRGKRAIFHFFMPVMAGLALLALLGSSGERTDLGAHFFGLLCGLVAGNIIRLGFFDTLRDSFTVQVTLSFFSFFIVYFCWKIAFV